MNIIILSSEFPPGPGGIGDHAFNLATTLVKKGHSVHVVTQLRKEFEAFKDIRKSGASVHYAVRGKFLPNLDFVRTYFKLLFSTPKPIVIATGSKSVLLAGLINFLWRSKLVAILHGHEVLMGAPLKKWLLRKVLGRFTHAVSVSEFSRQNSKKYIGDHKITVIPNGIDPERFRLTTTELRLDRAFHILTVGRISPRKGQLNVIRALPAILNRHPDVVYHMIGIHDEDNQAMDLVKKLGVEKHVRFHGVVSDEILVKFYQTANVFIMLSQNMPNGDVEGFGIAILEANYFGVPAIGSLGCGIEQAIHPNVNGFLVNPHEPADIVKAIDAIKADYKRFREESTEWANRHKWSIIIESYEKMLSSI